MASSGSQPDVLADRHVHVGVGVDLDDPGRALGPLQVAPGPVDGLGHACQQHGWLLPFVGSAWRRRVGVGGPGGVRRLGPLVGAVGGRCPAGPAARRRATLDPAARGRRQAGPGGAVTRVSTTQVSLLPPPWDELTTREPGRRATRVSPPRVT